MSLKSYIGMPIIINNNLLMVKSAVFSEKQIRIMSRAAGEMLKLKMSVMWMLLTFQKLIAELVFLVIAKNRREKTT